jgi:hypothetical protein
LFHYSFGFWHLKLLQSWTFYCASFYFIWLWDYCISTLWLQLFGWLVRQRANRIQELQEILRNRNWYSTISDSGKRQILVFPVANARQEQTTHFNCSLRNNLLTFKGIWNRRFFFRLTWIFTVQLVRVFYLYDYRGSLFWDRRHFSVCLG